MREPNRHSLINLLIVAATIVLFAVAVLVGSGKGEFGGTDAAATEQIESARPDYTPWFSPIWEQPGGEVESGLFALQAAIGAGILGFSLGSLRERRRQRTRPVEQTRD